MTAPLHGKTLWMAPMAGITDKPFRQLVREQGCQLAFTEMVSAKAILYNNRRTWNMLDLNGEDAVGVQLFGSEPEVMAEAARIAQQQGAQVIDINMGCPVPKIVNNGEGAALMRQPERAFAIVKAVAEAVSVPVTVKIRAGWDASSINAVSFTRGIAQAGARAVTVHGRTRAQMYSGRACWEIIARVVQAVDIPVIGNGDVWSGAAAKEMLRQTGCHGVMLARWVLGNPWLFAEAASALAGREYSPPSLRDRIFMAIRHLRMEVAYRGEKQAVLFMRKHLAWYLKGLPGASHLKRKIFAEQSADVIANLLYRYIESAE